MLVTPGDTVDEGPAGPRARDRQGDHRSAVAVGGTVKEVGSSRASKVKVGQVVLTLDNGAAPAPADGEGGSRRRPAGAGGRRQDKAAGAEPPRPKEAPAAQQAPRRARPERTPEAPSRSGEVVDIRGAGRRTRAGARQPPPAPSPAGRSVQRRRPPSVRRLARELGVDIRRVAGSGPGGRISAEDVQAYVRSVGRRRAAAGARRRRCPTSASGARSSASR